MQPIVLCHPSDVISSPLASGPLIASGHWPAARLAGFLLAELGATVNIGGLDAGALRAGSALIDAPRTSIGQDWLDSGLAAMTARADGPPLTPTGMPATFARATSLALELLSTCMGSPVRVDGARLLGHRIGLRPLASTGTASTGTASAGGAARLVAASDGWLALNLPRPDEIEMVPALVEGFGGDHQDPWAQIATWAANHTSDEVEQRAALLGLAVGYLPATVDVVRPWRISRLADTCNADGSRLVVNLGSLWAAPLCAQLLRRAGYQVIDVESPQRPDGARIGTPEFYRVLHEGHTRVELELHTAAGRAELHELLGQAAVVITASRPRALAQLGAVPRNHSRTPDQVWVRITGHGGDSERIAFGDDAAVAGGLVAWDDDGPVFAGDALADPLTGLVGGLTAMACLSAGGSWDIALSMRDIAAASIGWAESKLQ